MKLNKTTILLTTCLLMVLNTIIAQPHIKGRVEIDMNTGFFNCNFTMSNIPQLKSYRILLNKGMNIKYFKDETGKLIPYNGYDDGKMKGEALEYIFGSSEKKAIKIPSSFSVEYVGAFPKYTDELNIFDFKGVIAFNDKTVRATEQTKWYPVIYDVLNDRLINSYTYNITISINEGTTTFINGSPPKTEKDAQFISNKPYPLFLFAGNYETVNSNGDYIINTGIDKETAVKIFRNIDKIKAVLSKNLDIEFTDNIYLINHKPINKRKEGSSWGFNTYPSFAFTGLDFKDLVDENDRFSDNIYKYFGHEFGHNYFGNNVMSGNLSWFWLESFAEYLSYTVAEEISGEKYLKTILIKQSESLSVKKFIPLNKIEESNQIGIVYRYVLGPLILKCFEDTFGKQKINEVIKTLLNSANKETLTIEHWKKAAIQNGISENEYDKFEKKFIDNKNFKENVVEFIIKNYS